MKKAVSWIQKIRAKMVIFLIGKKMDLWLYRKNGDQDCMSAGIVEQYSGMYYGIWQIKVHNDGSFIEAIFRGF